MKARCCTVKSTDEAERRVVNVLSLKGVRFGVLRSRDDMNVLDWGKGEMEVVS